ncbi:MAG TPA: HAMP domain-containing sensor histidine kinase [bacterium]|nr:HAMP domain-containing sensor histidine kinase [bacterium]
MSKWFHIPTARLSILFLASTLVPGLLLSYFGIQTIAHQRELAEKRLLEAQNEFSQNISQQFDQQLQKSAELFFASAARGADPHELNEQRHEIPFLVRAFKISAEGRFLYPFYLSTAAPTTGRHPPTSAFVEALRLAQQYEYDTSRLPDAVSFYQQAFATARRPVEKAQALNGLARVLTKQHEWVRAGQYYQMLVQDFGTLVDETGVPFADYALHQLVRIARNERRPAALAEIRVLLEQISEGHLPISTQFAVLRGEVEEALPTLCPADEEERKNITHLLAKITAAEEFIARYHPLLANFAAGKRDNVIPLNEYDVLQCDDADTPCLLIIDPHSTPFLGFSFNLARLSETLVAQHNPSSVIPPLQIKIIRRQDAVDTPEPYSQIRELSIYAPDWRIAVAPQDPQQVMRSIRNRRLTYSITLGFLVLGMILGIVLAFRDITREHALSQLRSEFVSNVTHELKTPLTAIRMFAETLRLGRTRSRQEQDEYLNIIINESERLTRLIDTVLDFARIERGQKEYSLRRIDLSQTVTDALETLQFTLREGGFAVTKEIEAGVELQADPDAMKQALLNLLSNAIKYGGSRREIALRLRRQGDSAVLQVEDQGIGIAENELEDIFTPYYRAGGSEQNTRSGAGLGLAVVRHIVAAHNGSITVKSQPGAGSTFTITLPLEEKSHGG